VDAQPQGSSQSSQAKPPSLLQNAVPARQNPGNLKSAEQNVQGGEVTSQAVSSASPILQRVKNEMDRAAGPGQPARPLQMPASSAFGGFQARPPTLSAPHTVGGVQVHPGIPAQVRGQLCVMIRECGNGFIYMLDLMKSSTAYRTECLMLYSLRLTDCFDGE
jgi:hypothetical protein